MPCDGVIANANPANQTAHAHFHHPYKHTALDIFNRHFEPSLYQGASANSPAARTALEKYTHMRFRNRVLIQERP